jgi:Meiotically Up-regulated Gene 113 (MUG113) protein
LNRPGWIYALIATDVERVKIGYSTDPLRRWIAVHTASPVPVGLHSLTFHHDVIEAEQEAHARLHEARVKGEWFDTGFSIVFNWLRERERAWVYVDIEDLVDDLWFWTIHARTPKVDARYFRRSYP